MIATTDFRGVWIPRWSLNDQNRIFSYLDGHFNHIFLQVFALGEAYYPSAFAPSKRPSDAWLVDFLAEAHQRNIKVSAWINAYYSWGFAPFPMNERHPVNSHPGWFLSDRTGRSILDYSIEELQRLGLEGYYLSPAHPGVQAYLIALAHEMLSAYDFDGIHLDYIRYPGPDFVDPVSLESKFMRMYYVNPLCGLEREENQRRYGTWGCDDIRQKWDSFVHEDLTAFIKRFSATMRQYHGPVLISAAVKPNCVSATNDFHQDWVTWLNAGYIDLVCLMSYTKNLQYYFMRTNNVVHDPSRVTFGIGIYLLSPETVRAQVHLVDEQPFGGVVFFSYDRLKENPAYLDALKDIAR